MPSSGGGETGAWGLLIFASSISRIQAKAGHKESSWLEARAAGRAVAVFQPAASSHTTSTHRPARVRIHSTLGLTIIAHDQPLRFSLSCRAPHAVLTTHESRGTLSAFLFFSSSGFPPLSRPAVLSFFLLRVALAALSFCLLRVAPRATTARQQKQAL